MLKFIDRYSDEISFGSVVGSVIAMFASTIIIY